MRDEDRRLNCLLALPARDPDRATFLYFHCVHGHVYALLQLENRIHRTVVGVRAAGMEGEQPIPRTIGQMMDVYLPQLERAGFLDGPLVTGGFSSGGLLAVEAAARLRAAGRNVLGSVLVDTAHPDLLRQAGRLTVTELVHSRLNELLDEAGAEGGPEREFSFDAEGEWSLPPEIATRLLGGDDPEGRVKLECELSSLAYSAVANLDYEIPEISGLPIEYVSVLDVPGNLDLWAKHAPELRVTPHEGIHSEPALFADDTFIVLLENLLARLDRGEWVG